MEYIYFLQEEVHSIRSNTVSLQSRKIYRNSTVILLQWLYINDRDLMSEDFLSMIELDIHDHPTLTKHPYIHV